jgi:hypothetical protein
MTVSTNSMTLADYALLSNAPMVRAVAWSLVEAGSMMQDVPFMNRATLTANGTRWEGNLPTVSWVNVNEEGTVTTGTPTSYQEQAFIVRNNIDTDYALVHDINQITDPRAIRVQAWMEALAYDTNDKLINNNHVSGDKKAPVGIRARIDDGTTYKVRSENKLNGGGVDLTYASATAATGNRYFDYLAKLLWLVGDPDGVSTVLYCNDELQRRTEFVARLMGSQGGWNQQTDQFNRRISAFRNAPIRDVGRKADQSTNIITNTETSAGVDGSSTYTSIYAVRYGDMQFHGWQYEPPLAKDLGLLESGSQYRTHINWICGMMPETNRCIARLYGIKMS